MQNFDKFGERLNAKIENQNSNLLSDEQMRQLLIDVFYPKVDFIEFDKKNEFENIRLANQVKDL